MILNRLFRKTASPERRLYEQIVAAARHPVPYADWGVADSIDGRFDMIVLHLFLVLERLKGTHEPLRQKLVDEFFADMDRSLREMGVGDMSVAKKVRKMAEAFYGRATAYDKALENPPEFLIEALERNVFPDGQKTGAADRLARHALAIRQSLGAQSTARFVAGSVTFPEPVP